MSGASPQDRRFRVVVLTCDLLGLETAERLALVPDIEVLAVFSSPHRRPPLRRRLRYVLRTRGPLGMLRLVAGKILRQAAGNRASQSHVTTESEIPIIRVDDLHSPQSVQALTGMKPDLAVIDGTYILKPDVFRIPRLGSINLHCGKVPDYRGAPPVFWELYDGTPTVGITIHQVEEEVDAGAVYAEREIELDLAPPLDVMRYVRTFWRDVLRPAGIELLAEVVREIAQGRAVARPQPPPAHPVRRTPNHSTVRELQAMVRQRRQGR